MKNFTTGKIASILLIFIFVFTSCSNDDDNVQEETKPRIGVYETAFEIGQEFKLNVPDWLVGDWKGVLRINGMIFNIEKDDITQTYNNLPPEVKSPSYKKMLSGTAVKLTEEYTENTYIITVHSYKDDLVLYNEFKLNSDVLSFKTIGMDKYLEFEKY